MIPAILPQLIGDEKSSEHRRLPQDFPPPYIPLPMLRLDHNKRLYVTHTSTSASTAITSHICDKDSKDVNEIVIGRRDIIIALSSFCRCIEETVKEVQVEGDASEKRIRSFRPSAKCPYCSHRSSWIKRFVSMNMLRFFVGGHHDKNTWSVELLGINEKVIMVNGQELKRGPKGIMTVGLGSEILLFNIMGGEVNKDESVLFTIGLVKEENLLESPSPVDNLSGSVMTLDEKMQAADDFGCEKSRNLQERQEENDGQCETSNARKKRRNEEDVSPYTAVECIGRDGDDESSRIETTHHEMLIETRQHGMMVQNVTTHNDERPSFIPYEDLKQVRSEEVIDLISLDEKSIDEDHVSKADADQNHTCSPESRESNTVKQESVFFLQRGQQMSKTRVSVLIKSMQSKSNNLQIQMNFDKSDPPKYIVIDSNLSIETVQKELGFQDLAEMAHKLEKVHLVKPEWIIQYTRSHSTSVQDIPPTISQCWNGTYALHNTREAARYQALKTCCESIDVKRRKMSHDSASEENVPMKGARLCPSPSPSHGAICKQNQQRNLKLSKLFERISKLYSECPLSIDDTWRSYSYNIVSKRLQYLDFEVTNDSECLKKLASIKGFGSKVLKQCKEFLTSGKCQLIREFEHDDRRVAVRNMTKIWGVGPAKAWELVDMGYKNIIDVRNALEVRALDLSAGARVGVQFYEDFQEKMGRFEVRMISKIVEEAIKKYFPTAEVMTMGSYRRGKQLCGDVDILITHREYTRTVPLGALDELVERLKSNGHISHHLTHVDTKYFYAMLSQEGEFHPSIFPPHHDSQSYMGVFNSPSLKGKHRRIDIKFYPYQQKAFAMMYFTGNGYFNRSIRLYAKRHKRCRLNDHGLFPDHLGGGKSLKAKDEQEVFDKLGLVYKEPKDRNGFDDVVEKETNQVFIIEDVNKNEIMSEEKIARDVKWVD